MNEHRNLVKLINWIDEHTPGFELPSDKRSLLVQGCFDVALEHQAAIALLDSSKLHGSMLALLRVLTEAVVRGLWLYHCASENNLAQFKKGKVKSHGQLITEIENKIGDKNRTLSLMKKNSWNAMNEFTHTGYSQIVRRHNIGTVGANYSEQDLSQTLAATGALGLLAASQLAAMGNKTDVVDECIKMMKDYVDDAL